MLELVVAVAENDVIGRANALPWRLPADLKHFKSLTVGKHVLMGRKTFESIGKALPNRSNLVLTRDPAFKREACVTVGSLRQACDIAAGQPLMVIGGAEVYGLALPFAERIHLTLVHTRIDDGDTFFAAWRAADWQETRRESHAANADHPFAYSFITLQRRTERASLNVAAA